MLTFKFPFKTPSVNMVYKQSGWRRYMPKEFLEMKEEIIKIVQLAIRETTEMEGWEEDTRLKVKIRIHENWICKNGNVAKKDLDDKAKYLIDCVFTGLGIDDRYAFEIDMKKIPDTKDYTLFSVGVINENTR